MSSDGADMGVSAKRALDTVLGGEPQPAESEKRTPEQMRVWLLACPDDKPDDPDASYEWGARRAAKGILEAFLADESLRTVPIETEYDWDAIRADPRFRTADGVEAMREHVTTRGLSDVLEERGLRGEWYDGLTGFMWGWAVNAARYCVNVDPGPNPAIVTL